MSAESAKSRRIAMLIDCENARPGLVDAMLEHTSMHGVVTVRRAYGDWGSELIKNWREPMVRLAFRGEQVFRSNSGKNAADIAIVIDALDLLHAGDVEGFCIVSSDSDFTRLIQRLRETGCFVMGIGREHTPRSLANCYHVFVYAERLEPPFEAATTEIIDSVPLPTTPVQPSTSPGAAIEVLVPVPAKLAQPAAKPAPTTKPASPPKAPTAKAPSVNGSVRLSKPPNLEPLLRQSLVGGDWVALTSLGTTLRRLDPHFEPKRYGYAQLQKLLRALPALIECRPGKNNVVTHARLRQPEGGKPTPKPEPKPAPGLPNPLGELLMRAMGRGELFTMGSLLHRLRELDDRFDPCAHGHEHLHEVLLAHGNGIKCWRALGSGTWFARRL